MKIKALLIFLAISATVAAQESQFDGSWIGYIYDGNEEMINYLLVEIDGDEVTQYGYNSETEEYYLMEFDIQKFYADRNNALYFWLNQGGVWSETQSYHISLINERKGEILWTRQVNNIKDGDNEVWDVRGKGTIEKIEENTFVAPFVEAASFDYFTIASVQVTDESTIVTLTWSNSTDGNIAGTFHGPGSENAMYIADRSRSKKFAVKDISGATFGQNVTVSPGEEKEIVLYFESIGDLREFDLLEPGLRGTTWNFYGILLEE